MWILSVLPNWLFNTLPIVGAVILAASVILRYLPFISTYRVIIQPIGAIFLLGGIWLNGANYYYNSVREEIARIEKESKEATARVEKEYQEKLAQTKQRGDTIVKYVDKYITKESDTKCVIPNNFVILHDSAAHSKVPDSARLTNENPSGVTLSTTAKTVTENYATCNEIRDQLSSLQKWVKEQQKIRE
jgi:hypothetical protein